MTDTSSLARDGIGTLASMLSHGAVALLALVAMFAARDLRKTLQGKTLFLLALSVAALEVASGPDSFLLAAPVRTSIGLFGALNVALLWVFCLSILRDDFRIRTRERIAATSLVLGTTAVLLWREGAGTYPVLAVFSAIAPFVAIVHIGWVALSERAADLVEPRRRVRIWFPAALAVAACISVLSEEVSDAAIASVIRSGLSTLPIAIFLLWWLAAMNPARLRFETASAVLPAAPQVDPRDRALHAALRGLMEETQTYREPELSIDVLAERLSTPTHRLRNLINGDLGFRNFAAFINGYRLAHAKAAIADPKRARETISVIAFEAGFGSLQTFNRVFRDAEGVPPTEYRSRVLQDPSQNSKSPPIS